ncbi:MAG: hypothetical protein ACKOTF_08490 [Opitutaceae bacterium]
MAGALCGLWVDAAGRVLCTHETADGGREDRVGALRPFGWLRAKPAVVPAGIVVEALAGEGPFRFLAHGESLEAFEEFAAATREETGLDAPRPWESQYLLQQRARPSAALPFGRRRR